MSPRAPRRPAWLGLDLGTSAVKALLADDEGRILAAAAERVPLHTEHPLMAEQDAEDWWRAAVLAIQRVLAEAGEVAVAGVGLTGQKHALLPLDANYRPLRRAVLWCDGRAREEARHIREVFPAAGRRVGMHPQPGFLLPKWLRFAHREEGIADATRHLLFAKDYLRLRLAGTVATDRTEASVTQIYDAEHERWSPTLAEAFDLPLDVLPPVLGSTELSGAVTAEAAAETGLPAGTPIVAGAGDNEAAALACGVLEAGLASVTLGTSGTVVAWGRTRAGAGGLIWNRHVTDSGYAATGTVLSAGRALEWVARTTFPRDMSMAEVVAAAEASDPRAAPLVCVPSLVGERSPVPDPDAAGSFVGLRASHTRGHLARAVLEGVSIQIAEIVTLLRGAGVEVGGLRLTSGGAGSAFWRGLIAAAADLPVQRVAVREGPALGAALLAAVGIGELDSLSGLAGRWVAPEAEERADPDEVRRLRGLADALRSIRTALRGIAFERPDPAELAP